MEETRPARRTVLVGPTHPAPGGIVHFTAGLADALAERGPTLVVGWQRRFPERLYPGTINDESSTTVVSASGEAILDLLDPRTWRRAASRTIEFAPDAVVLQWWHPMHAPVIAALSLRCKRAGLPVVVVCHNVEPHETNAIWRLLTRRALGRAGALLVHSADLADAATQLVPRVPVIRGFLPVFGNVAAATGAGDALARDSLRERVGAGSEPLLLTFGYVRPYKGVEDAIAATARCASHARLLIAGECWDDPERYRIAAEASGVAERITLDFRYIPNDELPTLFGAADAVLLPYRDATQSGVAALAFAYDKPVIATRVGGLVELVEEGVTGALAPPGDTAALAAAIDRVILADRDWRPAMQRVRERFSWTRYVGLIDEAAAVAGRPRRDPVSHAVLDTASRRAKAAKIVAVLERTRSLQGVDLLDVGTGSGTIAAELAQTVGTVGSVTSVDVEDVRVERDGYAFARYDGRRLPFDDASFDVVVSNHVIEHVGNRSEQRAHVAELSRVLRPGGIAYVAVPHRWQLVENHYRLPLLSWVPAPLADRYVRVARGAARYDARPLTRAALRRLASGVGLATRDVTPDLIGATFELGQERSARLLRRIPGARHLIRGPLLPTIAVVGVKPR